MEIKGRDILTESYRVVIDVDGRPVMAYVPERLFADGTGGRPSHQTAYEGIAAKRAAIEKTISDLARGGANPRAPYDQIILAKDM